MIIMILSGRRMKRAFCSSSTTKLWGGRFTGQTDPLMHKFNASLPFDRRMWKVDIQGSKAYARGLMDRNLITEEENSAMQSGLDEVAKEWETGQFAINEQVDEDIHTANERRLSELIGSHIGGKLHTGRSRNDQVATDLKLWLREAIDRQMEFTRELIDVAASRALAESSLLMPGYTHLQRAQPVRWSHWLLSHAFPFRRDVERLADLRRRMDACPLGSGALAGHPFQLDRERVAADLGFSRGPTHNSLDSVCDRDDVVEFLSVASLAATHLSRFAEDLIIYSSAEFGFVSLSDAYSTGSSLMPQKRNPDALELLRGKVGRIAGNAVAMTMNLKGLPSSYNKDLQEDKELLFDAVDTLGDTTRIATGVLSTLEPNEAAMKSALSDDLLATDLADYLVKKGVPFRETHSISGQCVKRAEDEGVPLSRLSLSDLQAIHPLFSEDVKSVWSFESSVEARSSTGGTALSSVEKQVKELRAFLKQ